MLLNYLYAHFHEERDFIHASGLTAETFAGMLDARLCPTASYVIEGDIRSASFMGDHLVQENCRFHLKGHMRWIGTLKTLSIETEEAARTAFEGRYATARAVFLISTLGQELIERAPDVMAGFDQARAKATWGHFLNGVYGVCTSDGLPETIFVKQACVDFIDTLTAPDRVGEVPTDLLRATVDLLDRVEAEFAPHEVGDTSRQRCITDVRRRYLEG